VISTTNLAYDPLHSKLVLRQGGDAEGFTDMITDEAAFSDQPARDRLTISRQVAEWIGTAADYYSAAGMYERLSGLSEAELHRRGLSRANVGRAACVACDRKTRPT
jgi:hypothetical protein